MMIVLLYRRIPLVLDQLHQNYHLLLRHHHHHHHRRQSYYGLRHHHTPGVFDLDKQNLYIHLYRLVYYYYHMSRLHLSHLHLGSPRLGLH